jgi:hypothetical protein
LLGKAVLWRVYTDNFPTGNIASRWFTSFCLWCFWLKER